MADTYTLGQIAERMAMLEATCARCDRRGRYRLHGLIRRYGANASGRVIVPELTAACPKRNASLMERCDVHFPGMAKLFLTAQG